MAEKSILTSFQVLQALESWSKYTTAMHVISCIFCLVEDNTYRIGEVFSFLCVSGGGGGWGAQWKK